jgi:hypothetical protein
MLWPKEAKSDIIPRLAATQTADLKNAGQKR